MKAESERGIATGAVGFTVAGPSADRESTTRLLVRRVVYGGEQSTVSVTFHPAGIKTLADELEQAGK